MTALDVDPQPKPPTTPRHRLPAGACDCHAHVFGPFDRYPLGAGVAYLPPLTPGSAYLGMLDAVGVSRGVLVQPSSYGLENRGVIDAVSAAPARLRGIGVLDETVADRTLEDMHAKGIRGLRFTEMPNPSGPGRYPGAIGTDQLVRLAPRLKALGWHAQIWSPSAFIAEQHKALAKLGLPLVFDHMGMPNAAQGPKDPGFAALLGLVRDGAAWAKLSLCRVSQNLPDYPDARPLHEALITASAERVLWASDWPHVRMGDRAPNVGHLVDLFGEWVPDAALVRKILVDNPAALYGFAA
jgi:2-pyrone-4,6-dicarboxylate lactonase